MKTLERLYYFITETRAKDNWCRGGEYQYLLASFSAYPFYPLRLLTR